MTAVRTYKPRDKSAPTARARDDTRNKWKRFKRAARNGSITALENLVRLSTEADKEADQIRASQIVMSYGWGSPSAEPEPVAEVVDLNRATTAERVRLLETALESEKARLRAETAEVIHEGTA